MRSAMHAAWMSALMVACGGELAPVDGGGGAGDADVRVEADDADVRSADGGADAAAPRDASAGDAGSPGPRVFVHLRSTHAPVSHDSASSGQTPRGWVSGIRSLHLLRTEDDPDPVLVFSHGDGYVEASYADGADTLVGSAPLASVPEGTYTWARVVHTHVRFTIDATLHSSFGPLPGEVDELIVLSDRATLDGVTRAQGFYRYVFRTSGMEFPVEGSGFTLTPPSSGGFYTRIEGGESAYYFVAPLEVRDTGEDVNLVFEVNVHEGFRWIDADEPGFEPDVFDTTPASTETVVQAGANDYRYFVE